ncbi:MAG: respiratory nitrate reductase subunit gamma [Planctomycetes bacterium]|nr:respiratory nitrate reductase subunit gamma [Planctomycetota bacterium]MCP4771036.1 respiratory nitrate reductase subunit gamma [Planctomycetota bacterium]MCP4861754.1 respiratory nitrate reductase subunit gamma [Planctomycetota bacterium]
MLDTLLFVVLPYVALVLFFLVGIARYRNRPFSVSSLSSQFLENKKHFWSTVPFHYGILGVLAIHLAGLLIPDVILTWNAAPARLLFLEITGLALGIITLIGLFNSIMRRIRLPRMAVVTNKSDWVLLTLLMVQIILGILVSIYNGWGSSWFASSASPWLWSLFTLSPDISYVAAMPILVKLHIINAWLILGYFPFTRLIHVLVIPNPYLWRKTQVVMWHRDRKSVRLKD